MQHIICPIDFSAASLHALKYAIHCTNHYKGTIHIVHAYSIRKSTGMLRKMDREVEQGIRIELDQFMSKIKEEILPGTNIETYLRKGHPFDVLHRMSKGLDAPIIIMGRTGSGNARNRIFGSVSTKVMQQSMVPVMTVPEAAELRVPERIVLALDQLPMKHPKSLQRMVELINYWNAKLSLFHLISDQNDQGIHPSISEELECLAPSHHFEVSNEGLSETLARFLNTTGADILAMVSHHRGFFQRLFHESSIKKEAELSQQVMLIIPDAAE